MNEVVYDNAVLVAADRSNRRVWADHRARLELGIVPFVPTGGVAQVSRSRRQAQLRRFLRGCRVVPLDEDFAHEAGLLQGRARTSDVVDASAVVLAVARNALIVTGDVDDIEVLCRAASAKLPVLPL